MLLERNSVAGVRFEKATEAKLALALLSIHSRIQRWRERDPGETQLMTSDTRGQRWRTRVA